MARKTLDVNALRIAANERLANSENDSDDVRQGICSLLEHALTITGNYNGFRYLDGWPTAREYGTEHKRHYL